ncbi:MAG: hypothetical protein CVV30_10855 [Methanomicrobiales archaeon HGW-Methanomicrobiales-1]|jgi:hypothetical protein|nr:MAG: hypothetical protein CVV30_10855 [Methanomicrobiales archaeon HGW-Methanomicrobiales-1]
MHPFIILLIIADIFIIISYCIFDGYTHSHTWGKQSILFMNVIMFIIMVLKLLSCKEKYFYKFFN